MCQSWNTQQGGHFTIQSSVRIRYAFFAFKNTYYIYLFIYVGVYGHATQSGDTLLWLVLSFQELDTVGLELWMAVSCQVHSGN